MAEHGGRPVISEGYRVGMLTVVAATGGRRSGYKVWRCRCTCGKERELDTRYLQRGTITDCGCVSNVEPGQKDLSGQRFGKLVCLAPTDRRGTSGGLVWTCQCDCGNICSAVSTQLLKGYKKSCGCISHPPLKDFVGKHFGQLSVVEYAGKQAGMHRWRCICDCGKETVVGQTLLQNGKTKSCGCLQASVIRENMKLYDGTSVTILESRRKKRISSNTSGYTGVYRQKRSGKWNAQITLKGRTYYLGSFDQIEDAIKARQRGEKMHADVLERYYGDSERNST